MKPASIKQWPEDERPRERLMKHGASALSDAQLLAIILRTGNREQSALDLAMELLNAFGDLRDIEQASLTELCSLKGLGKAKATQVKAALELGRRISTVIPAREKPFTRARDVFQYFHSRFQSLRQEVFYCAMLDVKNRLLGVSRVSEGTLSASLTHPREAFRRAVREAAAAVIFVHNHPSGDPSPSSEDVIITEQLYNAGEIMGIRVLDHIIVGDGSFTSMLEEGYLKGR